MEKLKKTLWNEFPAIRILDDYESCQEWLCMSDWFKDYKEPKWEWGKNPEFNINNEKVKIFFESSIETYIIFESESLQNEIYHWLEENDIESVEYWEKLTPVILEKLQSDDITAIKEGILELKNWVEAYNSHYVDDSLNNVDLSLFGYDEEEFPEGDLWPNPLFDNLLEKHEAGLNQNDLINLIQALFNGNEEFMDCKATFTAINLLLKKQTLEIENLIIEAILKGLEGYEAGHRYFEFSLLDRLIDDIFPTFSTESIIHLLQNLHPDNLRKNGDNFISLAYIVLENNPNQEQRKILEDLIKKYGQ